MENRTETRMDMIPFVFNDNMVRGCLDDRGEPWFVARDVCRVLDIANNRDAVTGLDDDEKITVANPDGNPRAGIPHEMTLVSESGLYALVFRSRKPEARRFRKWVTAEVLPALRKKGYYARPGSVFGVSGAPGAATRLRPRMRREALALAVRMAGLDNGGSDEAVRWFEEISALLGGEDAGMENYSARHAAIMEQVTTFAADCLVLAPGRQESAARIYQSYLRWWDATRGERLNPHIFGRCLGNIYTKTKSGTVKYVNVRLREEYR